MRPEKIGLDYFPMDTTWDIKIKLLKAKYKLEGIGFIDMLYRLIYKESYYLKIDNDVILLLADEFGLSEERFREYLDFCLDKDLFSKKLYDKYSILTSSGIQRRYIKAKESKESLNIIKEYYCINNEKTQVNVKLTSLDSKTTQVNPEFSTQIKEKKTKEKKIKGKKTKDIVILPFDSSSFKEIWESFREHRKEIKKRMTIRSETMLLKKLKEMATDETEAIKIIEQTIAQGWQGLFEIKNEAKYGTKASTNRGKGAINLDILQQELDQVRKI